MDNKTHLKAFTMLVLISAAIHLVSRGIHAALSSDLGELNYFRIVELDLLFPQLGTADFGLLSLLVLILIYILCFYSIKK